MSTLKNNEEITNEKEYKKSEVEIQEWEDEQLDIFSDIIISILMKSNLKNKENER